eukprot:m.184115 g.184115  ORF g.184115 m.184115 type:complete len:327 (-) comp14709_c0_seq8:1121-2101(-)
MDSSWDSSAPPPAYEDVAGVPFTPALPVSAWSQPASAVTPSAPPACFAQPTTTGMFPGHGVPNSSSVAAGTVNDDVVRELQDKLQAVSNISEAQYLQWHQDAMSNNLAAAQAKAEQDIKLRSLHQELQVHLAWCEEQLRECSVQRAEATTSVTTTASVRELDDRARQLQGWESQLLHLRSTVRARPEMKQQLSPAFNDTSTAVDVGSSTAALHPLPSTNDQAQEVPSDLEEPDASLPECNVAQFLLFALLYPVYLPFLLVAEGTVGMLCSSSDSYVFWSVAWVPYLTPRVMRYMKKDPILRVGILLVRCAIALSAVLCFLALSSSN